VSAKVNTDSFDGAAVRCQAGVSNARADNKRQQGEAMSEKRRDGAWTEVARDDEVARVLPEEGVVISAAPERIENS
jgi:hypothetical protein